jgi:hypothetical protein
VSNCYGDEILGTFFNRHRNGEADRRTDLYYLQSSDFGKTWRNIRNREMTIPLTDVNNPARVIDYLSAGKNVYIHDMGFDGEGRPVCLYLTSGGHIPGPGNAPYEWKVTRWDGKDWITGKVCESDHNYDTGSLYIHDEIWKVVGPTENGPQLYGTGGEVAIWSSADQGKTWSRERILTRNSRTNHSYVRRPVGAKPPFCFFWADGNPEKFSISGLYFGDFEGNVFKLPYEMKEDYQKPEKIKY